MLGIFKKETPLLTVKVNSEVLCEFSKSEIPSEKTPSKRLSPDSNIEFVDSKGQSFLYNLGKVEGWFHFSIRLHPNLACQADGVVTDRKELDPNAFSKGAAAISFQPFFLTGAAVSNDTLAGKGLFARGLHFNGTITPSNVTLSCLCDACKKSFLLKSFHNGFGNSANFYSDSGKYTLIMSNTIEGAPAALSAPDKEKLEALEAVLPKAPDGTHFHYTNSLRCPHCAEPYIDFKKYPDERVAEYYGNYFIGIEPIHYPAK